MEPSQPGFLQQIRSFPRTFYVANTMEIFERMAWYGMFTPLALYLTDGRARGGLGLTEEDAGTIIGIVTFVLYLMPVITGALGDRFGYKKMFLLAYAILTPCYYLLGTYTHVRRVSAGVPVRGRRCGDFQAGGRGHGRSYDQRTDVAVGFWPVLHDGQRRRVRGSGGLRLFAAPIR